MTQHVGHRANDEVAPKAEQAPLIPWAKTISFAFGEELVERWNSYEPMQNEIKRLTGLLNEANAKLAQWKV